MNTLVFNGADYIPERDNERLGNQLSRVKKAIHSGEWKTLKQLSEETGDPEASISAQLRHLRKPRFGSFVIERRYVSNGLYEYRWNKGGAS